MRIISNRNRIRHRRVYDGSRMRHDTAPLVMAEAKNQSSHRPLHHRRHSESQKPQGRPHHLASARIAVGPTFNADRNTDSHTHSPEHNGAYNEQ